MNTTTQTAAPYGSATAERVEDISRPVKQVVRAIRTLEGGGFPVRRPFPTQALPLVDPFLLIDEMGPVDWPAGKALGAPDHPHRGFETVTYLLEGRNIHHDSAGNSGELNPGDVQWMTAGAGVVHSEMPHPDFQRTGGRSHGFQIWVNLPAKDKMMPPRYQDLPRDAIPQAHSADGKVHVRVVAGESLGVKAAIDTRTPIQYLHFTVQPGGAGVQSIPEDHNALVYVFGGKARLGAEGELVTDGELAELGAGKTLAYSVAQDADGPADFLVLSGVPLNEPVARYGPFVMNTQAEIRQAMQDYQSGKMGRIAAQH